MGKKKQGKVTLSLNDFLGDAKPAPGPKDVALPSAPAARFDEDGDGSGGFGRQGGYGAGGYGDRDDRAPREPAPIPDKAPFKIFIGNLDRDCTEQEIIEFFSGMTVLRFHAVNDRETMQFRGFGYVEFSTRDELVAALAMTGQQLMGRGVRIDVAAVSDRDTAQADERTNKAWRTGGGGGGGGFEQREPENDRATDSPWRRNDGGGGGGDRYSGGGGGRSYNDRSGGDRYGGDRYESRGGGDRYGGGGSDRYGGGGGDKYGSGGGGGWRGSGGDSYGSSRDDGPSERPKLKIAPRTKPVESSAPAAASGGSAKSNPFGAAKPIDTAAKEAEIERRLADKRSKDAPKDADKDVQNVTEGVAKVNVSDE
ncbi:hypothetical protein SARC_00821 [Sphaeroforma arctica JP610]|uniref:RRM domain-containing protein n=1 Tax=Sphaeroforma arctica JP610 TaxID=667725 RepID=A0A0L0GDK5_9EUKA|nr:hypothetical protein SARC_00821 [Sphaeroforma arctica JP610]KNC87077.1 hypothetical protein SARC_00821 [Sphaeroforma arctica JP610]|eukprot:XP_014160979.1 hypothetical protein SARC_00821 [Sphaeroforma arctica JP610]